MAATDSLIALLKPLLLTEAAHRAATLPPDAVQICELGPAAIYSFVQDHKSLIYSRHCYEMGGAIDSIVNRFILRPEWRLSPTQ